ncbi:MAG: histidine phosphatase family protein [Actinomycetota bacterium]
MSQRAGAVLVRHGETEWSRDGRHTGRSDIPLTPRGCQRAACLQPYLAGRTFARVLTSPLQRARETCRLAGFGDVAEVCADLAEWDYGAYEGLTSAQIQAERPGWSLWADGVPAGETLDGVGVRVDRAIGLIRSAPGDVALFAHGHVLRILTARWVGLAPTGGRLFALDPAGVSRLGYEHGSAVIAAWNLTVPCDEATPTGLGGPQ